MYPFKTRQQRRSTVRQFLRWSQLPHDVRGDVPWDLFLRVGPDEIETMLAECPHETRQLIRNRVFNAPATDEDWDEVLFLYGGTYTCSPEEMSALVKQSFRRAVETLRPYLVDDGQQG